VFFDGEPSFGMPPPEKVHFRKTLFATLTFEPMALKMSPKLGIPLNKMEKNAGDLGLQCRDSVKV